MMRVYKLIYSISAVVSVKTHDGTIHYADFVSNGYFEKGLYCTTKKEIQHAIETSKGYGKDYRCITKGVKIAKKGDPYPYKTELKETVPDALKITVDALKKREALLNQREADLKKREDLLNKPVEIKKMEVVFAHDDLVEKPNLNDAKILAVNSFGKARIFMLRKYPKLSAKDVLSKKSLADTCRKEGISFPNYSE